MRAVCWLSRYLQMPNVAAPLLVEASLRIAYSIGLIGALAFLGITSKINAPNWGTMINENRNGMIRRYLPKGTSLDDMAQDELDEITRRINGTPLKVLGWLTPAEAWDEQMERLAAQDTPVPGHPVQSTPTHNTRQCCTSN